RSRRIPASRTLADKADAESLFPKALNTPRERLDVVSDNVHVPGATLPSPRVFRLHISRLQLQEYFDVIATQNGKSRRIVFGVEPELLVPLHRRLDVADQKDGC